MSEQYISFPGTDGNFISTDGNPSIVGDLDMRAKLAATDWSDGGDQYFISTRSGNDGYVFYATATGDIAVRYGTGADSRANVFGDETLVNGVTTELKATWDVSTGALILYQDGTSVDTETEPNTAAGAGTANLGVGADHGSTLPFAGNVWWAEIRDGIDGTVIARMDAADAYAAHGGGGLSDSDTWTGSVDGLTWTANGSGLSLTNVGDHNLAGPGQLLVTGG